MKKKTSDELYAYVREADPRLFERVVQIASLVTCAPKGHTRLKIAATVEESVMSLVKKLLEEL